MSKLEITDRYQALGIPYPDPKTICKGQCEGTGWVPIAKDKKEEPWRTLWLEAEKKKPADKTGFHFVRCPDCGGTGLEGGAIKRITWTRLIDLLCDWEEQDVSQYRKGPAMGGVGPMRYYIRPAAVADKLKELGIEVIK